MGTLLTFKLSYILRPKNSLTQIRFYILQLKYTKINCKYFVNMEKFFKIGPNNEVAFDQEDILGQGGFGIVFGGVLNKDTSQRVAVKRFIRPVSEYLTTQHNFQNQVNILKVLNHPNIIKYYFSWKDSNGYVYIVTQRCHSMNLFHVLNEFGSFSQQKTRQFASQLISALYQMHFGNNHGCIIHRDLKPQNIYLQGENIKIGDFGLSKEFDQIDRIVTPVVGTPPYSSPQIINRQKYSQKCDVWSVGCIIFQMLTGQKLFDANNLRKLKMQQKDFNQKVKKLLKDKQSYWQELLLKKLLVYEQQKRATVQQVMILLKNRNDKIINKFLEPIKKQQPIIKKQEPMKKKPMIRIILTKQAIEEGKKLQQQKTIYQQLWLMIDFLYERSSLLYQCLYNFQTKENQSFPLTRWKDFALQFILLNLYYLEIQSLKQTLTQKQIFFNGQKKELQQNQSNKQFIEKKKVILEKINEKLKKKQKYITPLYSYLFQEKYADAREVMRKESKNLMAAIQFYQKYTIVEYQMILQSFLRTCLPYSAMQRLETKQTAQIFAQLYLVCVKQQRYPVKPPYIKDNFKKDLEDLKNKNLEQSKQVVMGVKKNMKNIFIFQKNF